jgi:hypothetical protein
LSASGTIEAVDEPAPRVEVEAITPIEEENVEEPAEDTPAEITAKESEETGEQATEVSETKSEEAAPIEVTAPPAENTESVKNTPKVTQQAEALKAALRRAQANQKNVAKPQPGRQNPPTKKVSDKPVEYRRRAMLLGKKASRTITADNGEVIVDEGAEITEEVLQKAKLANKFIELSMNYTP